MKREEAIRIAQGLITDFKCESETMVEFCNTVIKALEQQKVLDEIEKEINSPNRGTCDYFIVDRIEEIINKYKSESEG
jgi:hypothetical protein